MSDVDEAYDQTITTFSPEGRLLQVEYARNAGTRGTTAAGLVYDKGALLGVVKKSISRLVEMEYVEKIFQISHDIACASAGFVSDSRVLVEYARDVAQEEKYAYGEPITVRDLAQRMSTIMCLYTQYGVVRPFGATFLFIGPRPRPQMFEVDVSGAMVEEMAGAIGEHADDIVGAFRESYRPRMSRSLAIKCLLGALRESESSLDPAFVRIVYVEEDGFHELARKELLRYIRAVNEG